jgi:hypothetical protein
VLISRLFRSDLKCVFLSHVFLVKSQGMRWRRLDELPRRSIADVFRIQVVSNPDVRSPIITLGSTSFFHVRINNVYVLAVTKCAHAWLLAVISGSYPPEPAARLTNPLDGFPLPTTRPARTRSNASAALVFEFIYRFVSISRAYFGKLDEESVKNNFVLIYELLDGSCLIARHPGGACARKPCARPARTSLTRDVPSTLWP